MVRCLALNASFEPLTMVPIRRALRLVIEGKAEIVEADRAELVRSASLALPRPVIIRKKAKLQKSQAKALNSTLVR